MLNEELLLKILEYNKISLPDSLQLIGAFLGLEFYHEPETDLFTLSSSFFVLDISSNECTLIFVNESLNTSQPYISTYLTYFLQDKHIFFYLLKYLVNCIKDTSPQTPISHRVVRSTCTCLFSPQYCRTFELDTVPPGVNIFTHTVMSVPLEYYFYRPGEDIGGMDRTSEMDQNGEMNQKLKRDYWNVSVLIGADNFDKKYLGRFANPGDLFYEDGEIKVYNMSVYVKGKRSSVASLAFLRGCTLKESLYFAELIN